MLIATITEAAGLYDLVVCVSALHIRGYHPVSFVHLYTAEELQNHGFRIMTHAESFYSPVNYSAFQCGRHSMVRRNILYPTILFSLLGVFKQGITELKKNITNTAHKKKNNNLSFKNLHNNAGQAYTTYKPQTGLII